MIGLLSMAPFFRREPLFNHKFENMVIFRSGKLYSLHQETRIIRKLFIFCFFTKKIDIDNVKVVFLLALVINES